MSNLVVVTVTYGSRWHLLSQALDSAFREGVDRAIVVDNGATDPIQQHVAERFGDRAQVVCLGRNTGSAGGFKEGLRRAFVDGAEYVMLLDDDNELQSGCLQALREAYLDAAFRVPQDRLSVLAFRPDHQADVAQGLTQRRIVQRPSAFFGFHVLDIPFKIWRRLSRRRGVSPSGPQQATFRLDVAPYSGMMFHSSVLKVHGLPNEQLVLYADDTEFSYRLTRAGGEIILVTGARIDDLDTSWNVKSKFSSSFDQWLQGGSDFRAFYAARNQAYFERHCRGGHCFARAFNRALYLVMLRARAQQTGAIKRVALILDAIKNGEAGHLGLDPRFKL